MPILYWFWSLWETVTYACALSSRASASHTIVLLTFTYLLSVSPTGREASLWVGKAYPDEGTVLYDEARVECTPPSYLMRR